MEKVELEGEKEGEGGEGGEGGWEGGRGRWGREGAVATVQGVGAGAARVEGERGWLGDGYGGAGCVMKRY